MDVLQSIARQYGLFVALVVYVLWFFDKLMKQSRLENAEREARYISVIDKLSDSFVGLEKDVTAIKILMEQRERRGP